MAEHVPQYQDPFHAAMWEQGDADRLRNLLMNRTGKRLILRLRLDRPSLPHKGTADEVAQAARKLEGYEEAISNIFDYLVTPAKPEDKSTAYPNIDDSEAWPKELQEISRAEALPQQQPANPAEAELDKQTQETEQKGSK
jgi:hypothetical protein